ncbi:hypothetical protein [Aureimonas sp. AU40]|uniref:hypothetical protein n=1 Tax=Aureimonas sp. AU40 TaxID=1637747 RepID=UPI000781B6CC|nr:hypothetical protein [Aureimonas sp. AU40]
MSQKDDQKAADVTAFLLEAAEKADLTFNAPANVKLAIEREDGSFRKKPTLGGEEFLLQKVRIGARGKPIFRFEPADKQDYVAAEVELGKVGDEMPGFADWIVQLAESHGSRSTTLKSAYAFLELQAAKVAEQTAERAEQKRIEKAAEDYADNPNFGMF